MARRRNRWLHWVALAPVVLTACATADRVAVPEIESPGPAAGIEPASTSAPATATLTVMTLNLAHARGTGLHQWFQTGRRAEQNLDAVRRVLVRESPDIVALQEADSGAVWSGGFDHVEYLTDGLAGVEVVRGEHASGMGLTYGTTLVARRPLADPLAVTFPPRLLPAPKGFVVAAIDWPGNPFLDVDLVSVHLDFLRPRQRRRQAAELVQTLRGRGRPVILMGDLNAPWHDQSVVRALAQELELVAFAPLSGALETYPRMNRRLDWIMISRDLEFVSHRVLPDPVSDHRAVVAEIGLRAQPGWEQ